MATVDGTSGGNTGISAWAKQPLTLERTITITDLTFSSATDILQIMDVPAGFLITGGVLKVTTAFNADVNGQIGITGDDPNGLLTVQDLDATANIPFDGAYVAATSKHVDAADTIDMLFDTAQPSAGVFTLFVIGEMTVPLK